MRIEMTRAEHSEQLGTPMRGIVFVNVAHNMRRGYRGFARSYQRDEKNKREQKSRKKGGDTTAGA